jgi:predicted nucleic acid-binding protein
MTLVDTNVLLDLVTDDPRWFTWSAAQLDAAAVLGPVAINDAVYAELSVRFAIIESLDAFLEEAAIALVTTPRSALFLAGRAVALEHAAGGTRSGVLPDFFIGAHAAVMGLRLLSRDPRPYRTYFPKVSLVTP